MYSLQVFHTDGTVGKSNPVAQTFCPHPPLAALVRIELTKLCIAFCQCQTRYKYSQFDAYTVYFLLPASFRARLVESA